MMFFEEFDCCNRSLISFSSFDYSKVHIIHGLDISIVEPISLCFVYCCKSLENNPESVPKSLQILVLEINHIF